MQVLKERNFPYSKITMLASARCVMLHGHEGFVSDMCLDQPT